MVLGGGTGGKVPSVERPGSSLAVCLTCISIDICKNMVINCQKNGIPSREKMF